jgi:5-methyltetrahydropteroyltriglutamate--homocysteine methyltransferase
LIIAPDCGLKYLPRDVAFAKLRAMVEEPQSCGAS